MHIAAMAAGAAGGYFAARLAAAGHDVFFFARGKHRDAIASNGLPIESPLGDFFGPVDIVLFAVKLWDTEEAAEQDRPLISENTRLITLQNGVDSVERIVPILGDEQTIGGVANTLPSHFAL
jgi:2-dehydropantoate 2-reductase